MTDITFTTGKSVYFTSDTHDGLNYLYVKKVSFINVTKPKGTAAVYFALINHSNRVYKLVNKVRLVFCNFINVSGLDYLIKIKSYQDGYVYSTINISRSNFYNISYATVLASKTGTDSMKKLKF